MIKTTHDGRTIRTGNHYTLFRKAVWALQGGRCANCERYVAFDPEYWNVHHVGGERLGRIPQGRCVYLRTRFVHVLSSSRAWSIA